MFLPTVDIVFNPQSASAEEREEARMRLFKLGLVGKDDEGRSTIFFDELSRYIQTVMVIRN